MGLLRPVMGLLYLYLCCLGMRHEIMSAVEHGITVYLEGTLPMVSNVFHKFYNVSALWQETVFKFHKEMGLKSTFC
jgi:hypothetical protein